jgi:hypothetical protein
VLSKLAFILSEPRINTSSKEYVLVKEIGHDGNWIPIIGQVFHVLEFDRAGTKVLPGDIVKAKHFWKPYGYLLVESPFLNEQERLPIIHKTDFILATTVFDEPKLSSILNDAELLVTYVPKTILPNGFAGTTHALHYAITPIGTLARYYEIENGIHRLKPSPEKIIGHLVWDGEVKVRVIAEPDI